MFTKMIFRKYEFAFILVFFACYSVLNIALFSTTKMFRGNTLQFNDMHQCLFWSSCKSTDRIREKNEANKFNMYLLSSHRGMILRVC